jgi:hypothetical protein
MLKVSQVSNETVEATGEGQGVAIDQRSESQLSWGRPEKGAISDPGCWDRHLLATVPDSPLLFNSSSFLCCSGVRSL